LLNKDHEQQPDELMRREIVNLNNRIDVFKNFTLEKLAEIRAELLIMKTSFNKDAPHSTEKHIDRLIAIIDHLIKEVNDGN